MTSLALPWRRDLSVSLYPRQTFPDFMTRANLALIDSIAFLEDLTGAAEDDMTEIKEELAESRG